MTDKNRTKLTISNDVSTCELMRKIDFPNAGFIFPAESMNRVLTSAALYSDNPNDIAITHEIDTISVSAKCSIADCKNRVELIENLAAYIHGLLLVEETRLVEKFLSSTFGTEVLVQYDFIDTYTAHIYFSYELPFSQYALLADMLKSETRQFVGDSTVMENIETVTLEYILEFQTFDGLNKMLPDTCNNISSDIDKLKAAVSAAIRYDLNLDQSKIKETKMEDSVKLLFSVLVIAIIAIIVIALIKWIIANLGVAAIILLIGLFLAFIIGKR